MAGCQPFPERCVELDIPLKNELSEILKQSKQIKGPTTRFTLKPTVLTEEKLLRKERIGKKIDGKPSKVILMVGETGTGKTGLINAMVNYIMGVRWEHKMWLEVAEASETQAESQTTAVTVYEVYTQNSPFSLSVIDTPGQGDTRGPDKDKNLPVTLQQLFKSEDGIHEIHAVCIVLKATDVRLHDRQKYIVDEVLSLFGKDIEKHIIILITNSPSKNVPKKALNCIQAAKIPCAKTMHDQPVYFTFDNCQSETYDEEDRESYKASWDSGIENFKKFFDYLDGINVKSLDMTEGVLRARKQLDANVNNLPDRIKMAELKKMELVQTKAALNDCENYKKEQKNFEYDFDEVYKDLVPINASFWAWSKQATRCTVCKENCHYPGCWWVSSLSKCSVMTEGKCTICKQKCDHTSHTKDYNKYVIKVKKVKKTKEDLRKKYEEKYGKIQDMMMELENEIQELEAEKISLVEESYECFEKLMETALKSTSMSSYQHLDFLIEKVKETGNQERVQKLEELKKRGEEENKGLFEKFKRYMNI